MRVTIEDIHEYLKIWYDTEGWSDFNMAWDSGYTDYAAWLIFNAGAINGRDEDYEIDSFQHSAQTIEKAIIRRMKKYTKKQRDKEVNECFKDAVVYINLETNEHAFIKNDYVDYLMTYDEMKRCGYIPEWEYYDGDAHATR